MRENDGWNEVSLYMADQMIIPVVVVVVSDYYREEHRTVIGVSNRQFCYNTKTEGIKY
jgi:hypothetical protein